MKNIYEIFDEFEMAESKKERMAIIGSNLSQTLVDVLKFTFHPDYNFLVDEILEEYVADWENKLGYNRCQLGTELRKLYMFRRGDDTAESLSPRRRKELLILLLESLDPRESEVVMGIFRKDQGVRGLTYSFVKEAFPNMLP